ncbi:MAG: cobalamin-dependent protein [Candidatus Omnitrophica bacterium]|nr:cobalamin-dependent protein [Candidatus Omnitrophota bacterium]
MSILLINPPRKIAEGNIWKKIDRSLPPLGLAYIASYLEQQGHKVSILDLQAEELNSDEFKERIKNINPAFAGITSTTVESEAALLIARLIKEINPMIMVILGGVHPSIMPEEMLKDPAVDFVARGEGEYTLSELLTKGKDISSISGLSYRFGQSFKHNPDRPFIESLDEMPLPAYHLLPMEKYRPSQGNYKRLPAASMIATRGCPGRCTFCYTGVSGRKIRTRSAQNLVKEIKLLKAEYKIKEISFYDDTFTAFKENIADFCRRITSEKIDITWSCMSRVDYVDARILALMKKAGCHQIGYGIESASPEILKNIKKTFPLESAKEAVELTKKAGIDVRAMFMLGNPGETEETLADTVDFALSLKPDIAVFNITTPLPGTEMYEWAKSKGYLLDLGWDKFDLSHVVMHLPTVSDEKIIYYYRSGYRRFYFNPGYILKRLCKIRSFADIRNNMMTLFSLVSFQKEAKER